MKMVEQILHVTPIDLNYEIHTVMTYYHDHPVIGMNGYIENDRMILMYDIDHDLTDIEEKLQKLPVPSLVMKTHKGYHVINPMIVSLKNYILIGMNLHADPKHMGHTMVKGYPSLRMGIKPRSYSIADIKYECTITPNCLDQYYFPISTAHIEEYCKLMAISPQDYMVHLSGYPEYHYTGKVPIYVVYR